MLNQSLRPGPRWLRLAAIVLTMLVGVASLSARPIDFSVKSVTVREAVMRLQRQSGMAVSVNADNADLDRRVSINVKSAEPVEILKEIFKGQNVQCTVTDGALVVRRSAPAPDKTSQTPLPRVSGTVVSDTDGEPLIGASVVNKAAH